MFRISNKIDPLFSTDVIYFGAEEQTIKRERERESYASIERINADFHMHPSSLKKMEKKVPAPRFKFAETNFVNLCLVFVKAYPRGFPI